ncbi:Protein ANTAGONIST OF LIKE HETEROCHROMATIN PROTEIN 1 [Gracilariopsis chorda]|uniref:Protein ANTAGONIST OF LIKE HETEROCHROMATIN PROTEIN 1 n=1 Tax=Gracilariopsis chorda TaxID=448386 RepID=A0A2V3IHF2_9FLOR|nr:Protein ANTAGONIST OF LIKE HETEROCHROMATIN PROTEIN 1 [Gracilariopsis chorda]|eukprot:PXF41507.1 Protein ANTAGONIST OF LIKE HETEROCHROMATIN PROTEIN 1 [Gracilariopsis chorda]
MSTSSDSSNDDVIDSLLLLVTQLVTSRKKKAKQGGSKPGKQPNRDIGRESGKRRLDQDYFCRVSLAPSVFLTAEFERRFSVTRTIYESIRTRLLQNESFFNELSDCCHVNGASTDQKLCAALRQLSSGATADTLVDYFRLSETTLLKILKHFSKAIVQHFEEYIRRPTHAELLNIEKQYAKLGFPGCIGCVDCSSWEWARCPVGLQGQFIGKEGRPCVRMETVTDDKLWIWHILYGVPGARNDRTTFDQSPLFNDIKTRQWPTVKPNYVVGGMVIDWFYFLADGIYPSFRIFAKPHPNPTNAKSRLYTASHSSARKAVERLYGVLDAQFEILSRPCRLHHLQEMNDVVMCCAILHNMIVKERGYEGTAKFRIPDAELQSLPPTLSNYETSHCTYRQADLWRETVDDLDSVADHNRLLNALIQNIWNAHGDI